MKIYKTFKINNILKLFLFISFLLILFLFSKQNFESSQKTIKIFFYNVMPSLFPFILFTEIILNTDIIHILSNLLGNLINKIFKIDKNCTSSIIIGFLCGFPMGAKSVIHNLKENLITNEEATILLSFINNCNPIFILSTISINLFNNINIGIVLIISHVLSSIILGIIYSRYINNTIILKKHDILKMFVKKNDYNLKKEDNTDFFDIFKKSILNSFITLELILGFMLIFNILSNIITKILFSFNFSNNITYIFTALFEITNGCYNISILNIDFNLKISLISFMLGFSGFCILFQIYSVIFSYKFSLFNLFKSKLLHGIISFTITYILLKIFNVNNVIETFSTLDYIINFNKLYIKSYFLFITLIILIKFLLIILYKKYKRKNKKSSPKFIGLHIKEGG